MRFAPVSLVAAVALAAAGADAATVHRFNVIGAPTALMDFEPAPVIIPADIWFQDGLRIEQVDGTPGDIWTASGSGEGNRSWYPSAGDDGWTRITRQDGSEFEAVGFMAGSGSALGDQSMYYELALNGVVVQSGHEDASFHGDWFGITGGGFDEIRMRVTKGQWDALNGCSIPSPGTNACNFLWLDNIQIGRAVDLPEPTPLALLMGSAAFLTLRQRRLA